MPRPPDVGTPVVQGSRSSAPQARSRKDPYFAFRVKVLATRPKVSRRGRASRRPRGDDHAASAALWSPAEPHLYDLARGSSFRIANPLPHGPPAFPRANFGARPSRNCRALCPPAPEGRVRRGSRVTRAPQDLAHARAAARPGASRSTTRPALPGRARSDPQGITGPTACSRATEAGMRFRTWIFLKARPGST